MIQRGIDGEEFAADLVDRLRAFRLRQSLAQQLHHFAVGASALALVFVEDHIVERIAEDFRLAADVVVAAIAGAADDDRAAVRRHRFDGAGQCLDRIRVVAVIGNDGGAAMHEHVEAARRGVRAVLESAQAFAYDGPVQSQPPCRADGGHRVFDLEADRAVVGDRDVGQRQALFELSFDGNDRIAIEINDALALRAVCGQRGLVAVFCEIDDVAGAASGHIGDHRVGCIQHAVTVRCDVLHDHALDDGEVLDGGDEVEPGMIADAAVGSDGCIAAVEGDAFAQDAAARGFENGGVDVRMLQHVARAARAAAIAGVDAFIFDVDAVGGRHADTVFVRAQHVRNQAYRRRLAVGAGNGDNRDAAVVAFGEHAGDNRFADRTAFAERRLDVHAQARRGINFDHAAALFFQRLDHVFADQIDAGDVQPDHLRGLDYARRQLRMHVVGDVGGGAASGQV